MAIRSGLAAQLGIGVETTYGTAASSISRFYEFNEESLALTIERIESAGLRAGQRVLRADRYTPGQKAVEGTVAFDVTSENFGLLFEHALGTVNTTTLSGSAKQHQCILADPYSKSLTLEVGRPGNDGTVRAYQYTGAKVQSFTLSSSVNELLQAEFSFVGKDEVTGGSLATASYPSSQELLSFAGATISVAGSSYSCREVSLEANFGLNAERYVLGSQTINAPVAAAMTEITGNLTAELVDLTAYNRIVNNTQTSLTMKWEGTAITGTYKRAITVTMPAVRFDGNTPAVAGPEIVDQELTYKVLAPTDGSEPITIDIVNTDATA
jgi:hypothetical protein